MTTIKKTISIKNTNIYLDQLINLDFIKIIYELNKNFFEYYEKRERENSIYIINKWLFKDAGAPQTAFFMKLKETRLDDNVHILIEGECYEGEESVSPYVLLSGKLTLLFDITDKHNVNVTMEIFYENVILDFYEKMLSQIIGKIINNTKQFIEKMI